MPEYSPAPAQTSTNRSVASPSSAPSLRAGYGASSSSTYTSTKPYRPGGSYEFSDVSCKRYGRTDYTGTLPTSSSAPRERYSIEPVRRCPRCGQWQSHHGARCLV